MSGKARQNRPVEKNLPKLTDPPREKQTVQISFNFQHLSTEYGFGHSSFKEKHYEKFFEALCVISTKTWEQANGANKHTRIGTEKFPISDFVKQLSPPSQFNSKTEAIAFRYYENRPMLGFREGQTFYVVWIEAEYGELYIHNKQERQNRN